MKHVSKPEKSYVFENIALITIALFFIGILIYSQLKNIRRYFKPAGPALKDIIAKNKHSLPEKKSSATSLIKNDAPAIVPPKNNAQTEKSQQSKNEPRTRSSRKARKSKTNKKSSAAKPELITQPSAALSEIRGILKLYAKQRTHIKREKKIKCAGAKKHSIAAVLSKMQQYKAPEDVSLPHDDQEFTAEKLDVQDKQNEHAKYLLESQTVEKRRHTDLKDWSTTPEKADLTSTYAMVKNFAFVYHLIQYLRGKQAATNSQIHLEKIAELQKRLNQSLPYILFDSEIIQIIHKNLRNLLIADNDQSETANTELLQATFTNLMEISSRLVKSQLMLKDQHSILSNENYLTWFIQRFIPLANLLNYPASRPLGLELLTSEQECADALKMLFILLHHLPSQQQSKPQHVFFKNSNYSSDDVISLRNIILRALQCGKKLSYSQETPTNEQFMQLLFEMRLFNKNSLEKCTSEDFFSLLRTGQNNSDADKQLRTMFPVERSNAPKPLGLQS